MESIVPTQTVPITPATLVAAFSSIPDPRREGSVVYPLPAVLALAVAALLCAHTSVLAMAEWGSRQSTEVLQSLGFPQARTPCQTTLHRLFRKLDAGALAAALRTAFAGSSEERARGAQGIAIDGKAQRGRLRFPGEPGVIHALVAVCHEQGLILLEEPIADGAEKVEAELTVAPRVIEHLDWQGRVLTGDALYCQRELCQQVLDRRGDYLLTVKANQRRLHQVLLRTFHPQARPLLHCQEVRTIDKGHGRIEVRHLRATADPSVLPDWPGVAQLIQIERIWWEQGRRRQQVRYAITSLPPAIGTAPRLLALKRQHWLIENRSHRAKDVSFGEDASLIHTEHGPSVCSVLRSLALSLLRQAGYHAVTARLRYHSQHPQEAVALLLRPLRA